MIIGRSTSRGTYLRLVPSALLLGTLLGGASPGLADTPLPGQWERGTFLDMGYRILLPEGYDPLHHNYPLTLFLHGSGERGNDNESQLNHGIRKLANFSDFRSEIPTIIVAPQCPFFDNWGGTWYGGPTPTHHKAVGLVRNLVKTLSVDPKRIYVTGISMGGFGAWDMVARYPTLFSAAMPLSGAGDLENAERLTRVPVWAFHGAEDDIVPPDDDRHMFSLIQEAGGMMKYTEISGLGHGGWEEIYLDLENWKWLLAQRLQAQTNSEAGR